MFNFKIYEWQEREGVFGWQLFDDRRRIHKCHGAAAANLFGVGSTWSCMVNHTDNSEQARVYLYSGTRKFKFVKES